MSNQNNEQEAGSNKSEGPTIHERFDRIDATLETLIEKLDGLHPANRKSMPETLPEHNQVWVNGKWQDVEEQKDKQ